MKDFSKVMLSFIVGALAGAAAGLLLAPDKGENTRKKLKNSMDDLSSKAKDTVNDLSSKAKNTVDDLSSKAKNTVDDLSTTAKKTFSKDQVKENKPA